MFVRLLDAQAPATLGPETRTSTGPVGTVLFTERYDASDRVPPFVALPESLASRERVLLNLRFWGDPAITPLPSVRVAQRSFMSSVDRDGPVPRTRLRVDLGGATADTPVTLQAVGFPALAPHQIHQARLTLPPDPIVEFGYGVREECWGPEAVPTRFSLTLARGSGETVELFERSVDPAQSDDRRWFDTRIDLARWAGEPVTLRFETTLDPEADCSLPAWSDPVVYSTASPDPRPNVIVVSIDTLRARSLGAYGYGRNTSPFIDSLADAGALFEQAITTSVTTAPSHMSLFTGLYPVHHGIRRGSEFKRADAPTLADAFRAAGYRTLAFTENGYLLRARGFGDGFSRYTENRATTERGRLTGDLTDARVTFAQARAWLGEKLHGPFFLFVHTYEVHSPYRARAPHATRFADDDFPGPARPSIREERDNYDREVRVVDDELRLLLDALETRGLSENTIVVVLADHGEEFQEHGLLQHGGNLFDESLRIPLIFWGPGRIAAGRRIAGSASLIDVAPTLLDLVGVSPPEGLDGQSLLGAIETGELEDRQLFAEAVSSRRWVDLWKFETWNPPLVAVRSAETKFIVHRPKRGEKMPTVRYDLVRDPLERAPIPVEGALLEQVDGWVDGYLRGVAPTSEATPEVTPDERDRLRALGYGE